MLDSGYWTVGRIRNVPVRLHWTIPVGALVFGRFQFVPAFWLAFFFLVFIHELGHAALVWRYGHRVVSIDVTGFGGLCRWSGHAPTRFERAAIAWGGVLAQGAVLIAAVVLAVLGVWGVVPGGAEIYRVFVYTNLFLMVFNLLPIPPFDGAEAWPILGMLPDFWRRQGRRQQGREVWKQVLQQPPPKRRYVRRRNPTPAGSSLHQQMRDQAARRAAEQDAAPDHDGSNANEEIARLLERVGDEARRARLGKDEERKN